MYKDRTSAGFTLLEVMIALGLGVMLMGLGLVLSMDVWRGTSFRSEQDVLVSLLYKVRSRAVSNIHEENHGLYIDKGNKQYVIFEGDLSDSNKLTFDMSKSVTFDDAYDDQIIFAARTANTLGYTIRMMGEGKENIVTINEEGGITW